MPLSNKIVVIVGGAGLLGRRFCQHVAHEGAHVVVADSNLEQAEQLAQALSQSGHRAEAAHINITNPEEIDPLIARLDVAHGRIDAVVVCAYPRNTHYGRTLSEVRYEDFCENLSLHLGGYFLVAQRFGLYFQEQGQGNIVMLGSIYGSMAPRFELYAGTNMTMPVEYAAIKGGLVQLMRYFAQWFKHSGVRVNCLSPGGIFDGQPERFVEAYGAHTAHQEMLRTDDVCGSLTFLLSDGSRHITGQNLIVDDGFSL